jgi:hypothetical protein
MMILYLMIHQDVNTYVTHGAVIIQIGILMPSKVTIPFLIMRYPK